MNEGRIYWYMVYWYLLLTFRSYTLGFMIDTHDLFLRRTLVFFRSNLAVGQTPLHDTEAMNAHCSEGVAHGTQRCDSMTLTRVRSHYSNSIDSMNLK